jgi:hypothetical protein
MEGQVKTKTHDQLRSEKAQVWEDSVQATGCKKELDAMQECSKGGDWRKCKEEMELVKRCMEKNKRYQSVS